MNSYLLYGSNIALHTFTAFIELQFHISETKGKIVQNVKFLSVSQTSGLISKLDATRQHESKVMLSFQNRALDIRLLKIHTNQDNRAYLKKPDVQWKLVFKSETAIRLVTLK